jgi:hypothetical protein
MADGNDPLTPCQRGCAPVAPVEVVNGNWLAVHGQVDPCCALACGVGDDDVVVLGQRTEASRSTYYRDVPTDSALEAVVSSSDDVVLEDYGRDIGKLERTIDLRRGSAANLVV